MHDQTILYPNLRTIEKLFSSQGLELTNLLIHPESSEYEACSFTLNGKNIEYRTSKITPTKTGQFVTIWKRNKDGITAPFDISDKFDFVIISSKSEDKIGQFIFPKSILAEKGIISNKGKGGKRGTRVYPPWDNVDNKQAKKTQNWQIKYFVEIKANESPNFDILKAGKHV